MRHTFSPLFRIISFFCGLTANFFMHLFLHKIPHFFSSAMKQPHVLYVRFEKLRWKVTAGCPSNVTIALLFLCCGNFCATAPTCNFRQCFSGTGCLRLLDHKQPASHTSSKFQENFLHGVKCNNKFVVQSDFYFLFPDVFILNIKTDSMFTISKFKISEF